MAGVLPLNAVIGNSAERLDTLIRRVYDAVTDPGHWEGILDEVAGLCGARAASIVVGDPRRAPVKSVWLSSGVGDFFDDDERSRLADAARPLHLGLRAANPDTRLLPVPELLRRHAGLSGEALDISGLDEVFADGYGIHHRAKAPLTALSNQFDVFILNFGDEDAGRRQSGMRLGDRLLPHLGRALEIGRPFAALQARYATVLDVLDRLQLAVLVVGADRSIWLSNGAAQAIVERGDAFTIDGAGRLAGCSDAVRHMLDFCLETAGPAAGDRTPRPIRACFDRGRGRRPGEAVTDAYVADVSPMADPELGTGAEVGVVMILADPDRDELVDLAHMADVFSLTPSEEAVCDLLIKGYSNGEIADLRNVSRDTVASQVKALFQKTRSSRRGELIHLAHRMTVPLACAESEKTRRGGRTFPCSGDARDD